MKKTLAIVLTVVFVLGLSAVAFADTTKKILEPITTAVTNAVSSDSTAVQNENNQESQAPNTILQTPKLEISTNEEIIITATTHKKGQFDTVSQNDTWALESNIAGTTLVKWGDTVWNKQEGSFVSTAKFSSTKEGTYTIKYTIEIDAGKNEGKFTGEGSIYIRVVEPEKVDRTVTSFTIAKADIGAQDSGNDKLALFITELNVTYTDGTTEDNVPVNIKIGNIYSKKDRNFDVTYGEVTLPFMAKDILKKIGKPYPGPIVTTPEKSKQPEKPQTPVKPEKPEKPEKPTKQS